MLTGFLSVSEKLSSGGHGGRGRIEAEGGEGVVELRRGREDMVQDSSGAGAGVLRDFSQAVEDSEQLQAYFTKVLELPEAELEEWQGLAVVVWSLGRRVSTELVAKEVRSKANLAYEPEVIWSAEDDLVVRLKSEKKCTFVRSGGS